MRVSVLGSAAGGGFPQWNCNCRNCKGVREKSIKAVPRTQSSIAVTSDSKNWLLINASPDVLHQIAANPLLHPAQSLRTTPICAVFLVDSQIDHTLGLLLLREGEPLQIYCTQPVYDDLTHINPIFQVLRNYCSVQWNQVQTGQEDAFEIEGMSGLRFRAISVIGKAPPYSPRRSCESSPESNVALILEQPETGQNLFYAPSLYKVDEAVAENMKRATCLMVDGTFWTDEEMIQAGVGSKRAQEMGHLAQSGPEGMLTTLAQFPTARRILIHINNTNPILDENSMERRLVEEQGIEVAYDGMEIILESPKQIIERKEEYLNG